jgi:hypothetical protein
MAPICDEGFGRSTESVRLRRAQSQSSIRGIGHSLEAAPEDLPSGNPKAVTPRVIPTDVHEPDEVAARAVHNRKCAANPVTIIVLSAGDLPPSFPVRRRFDEPRLHMVTALMIRIRTDCVVGWHNPPLIEIVAYPIVPPVRDIF